MPETGNALSRNPNICASCSSMADGMDEPSLPECPDPVSASEIEVEISNPPRLEVPPPPPTRPVRSPA